MALVFLWLWFGFINNFCYPSVNLYITIPVSFDAEFYTVKELLRFLEKNLTFKFVSEKERQSCICIAS